MSEKLARQLFDEAQRFNAELSEAGWSAATGTSLNGTRAPVDLFKTSERPLVVGLFGGTGVGKSSLLNRLADADIARTGVVRPTSMEITGYLHQDVQLDALPEHFASDRFSDNRHSNAQLSEVMWVDMPDFDSNETENRDQVLQWLPHIDLLIYVVTPERYKDAEGWQMMLEHGYKHAWLFVINQWDKADPIQHSDFTRMLESNGFQSPEVFRTVCGSAHADDQFDKLVSLIESLAKRNVINHLQERGWLQRLASMWSKLKQNSLHLTSENKQSLKQSFNKRWAEFENASIAHLDAPFKTYSALFNDNKTNPVNTVLKSLTGKASSTEVASNIASKSNPGELWDDWLSVRMKDAIQQFSLADGEHGVPAAVMELNTEFSATDSRALIESHLKVAVDTTIESPGNQWQRLLTKAASILKVLLPLVVLGLVIWRVVNGFAAGAADRTAYVGFDFLVNGIILAGLGWLVPILIEKLFVPSLPDAIYQGLHRGLRTGLTELGGLFNASFDGIEQQRTDYLASNAELDLKIEQLLGDLNQAPDPQLSRVLMSAPHK